TRLRSPKPEAGRAGIRLQAIREGLGFVWRSEVILGCMALDMFAVIFGGASALLPIYATDILHVGARGYGILASSFEVGALVASAARPSPWGAGGSAASWWWRSSRRGCRGCAAIGSTSRSPVAADHPDVSAPADVHGVGKDQLDLELARRLALVQRDGAATVDRE